MAWPQRGLRPLVCSLVLAWLGVASFAAPASAHEGEEEVPARTQVAVADALLRTQPEQMDLAADRALGRVPLHGTARPVLLTVGAVLALGGLVMAWRIR